MDLPRPPEDIELRNIIDKLAQFVARNGPEFEQMTKNKQRDNPKFAFLFGGEFFNYYQYKVTTEQAILKQKFIRDHNQPMSYPPSNYGPPPNMHDQHPGHNGPTPSFGRPYNYGPPPAWNQPHHGPPPMANQLPPFPGQNPMPPPQTDLVALRGAKDVLLAQQKQLQEQIKQSEQNLAAQHQVTLQQQKHQTEEAVKQQNEKEVFQRAHDCGISLPEFDSLLGPIMDSCTKESISQGKSWILHHAQQQQTADAIAQYLLFKSIQSNQFTHKLHLIYLVNDVIHHCGRKGVSVLLRTLEHCVVQMFCNACLSANDEEQQGKLHKLLTLWQSKSDLFERAVLERLHAPQQVWNEYHSNLIARYSSAVTAATNALQQTYESYRGQHQAFVNHANHQLQQLEQQKQQIEEQIKAASTPVAPFGPPHHQGPSDYYSRPPPMQAPVAPTNFPAEGIEPKAPYYDLPAGLMVPLVKMEDSEYKSIDPKDIRLPPPLPPSERLIQAIENFYAPPSHDRPRNAEGWEQLAFYEFYKNKTAAKKKKEDDISEGIRNPSPPPSPVEVQQEESKPEEKGRNGVRSPTRKRFRSESPEDEPKDEDRRDRDRSRSRSPRRNSSRQRRSRSSSTSPRRVRSHSDSRSDSRSNSPYHQAPSFQLARSPTPPTELASMSFSKGTTSKLDESNRGHQLLRKMGWGGAGLGANEQGIAEPIKGGEVRDRVDQYKGVGIDIRDPFESFRKSKGQAFITRMRSRAEEREKEKGGAEEPPTP